MAAAAGSPRSLIDSRLPRLLLGLARQLRAEPVAEMNTEEEEPRQCLVDDGLSNATTGISNCVDARRVQHQQRSKKTRLCSSKNNKQGKTYGGK